MPANSSATTILVTLVAYKIVLLAIGVIAERWNRNASDFLLGGRSLGPLVAAISASASSSSVWTLLGVSGFAYSTGVSAIWLLPACVGGFALNWFVIAPRLRRQSTASGALTLTEFLAGPGDAPGRVLALRVGSLLILLALIVYVASQFRGAGQLFDQVLGGEGATATLSPTTTIMLGAAIVVVYTVLGGFWAVSLTDTLQGLMMAATAIALPIAALIEIGGPGALLQGIETVGGEGPAGARWASPLGGLPLAAGVGMVAGLLGIGVGYPGQPHVVNRFMALGDDRSVVRARRYAMLWAVVVYSGMIVLGLSGRMITSSLENGEKLFFELAATLFSPLLAGVLIAAVLSAIMSTCDSQLLVAAASISHDIPGAGDRPAGLTRSRIAVLGTSAAAAALAVFWDKQIFDSVLFAWDALGAAFGPLLIITLWRTPLQPRAAALVMLVGFGASVTANLAFTTDASSKWIVRWTPYLLATAVALASPPRGEAGSRPATG